MSKDSPSRQGRLAPPVRIKLTDANVRAMKPSTDKNNKIIYDSVLRNFAVRITPKGTKSWIISVRKNTKRQTSTVGRCDRMPVMLMNDVGEEVGARQQARDLLNKIGKGIDIQEEIKEEKHQTKEQEIQRQAESITLAEVKAEYIAKRLLRPNSVRDINCCLKEWDGKPVAAISTTQCEDKYIEMSIETPAMANRDFRNLKALLNYIRERYSTEDGHYRILAINPVVRLFKNGVRAKWNKIPERKTRIPKDKIGEVYHLLEQLAVQNNNNKTTCTSADLILFLLFTGCRIGEARSLTWENVNLSTKVKTFTLPKEIVKNHNEITLPISSGLATVIDRRWSAKKPRSNYVFPATVGKAGHIADPRAMFAKITKAAGVKVHPHAIRRTFDDIGQLVAIDWDKRRQLLNHKPSDVHGLHYSNDPDPEALLPAAEQIGQWIFEQGEIAADKNIVQVEFTQ